MFDNEILLNSTRFRIITRKWLALFLVALLLTLAANNDLFAAGKVKSHGTLTSIEDDGSVIIDQKGYLVSPSVTVLDYRQRNTSLSSLPPSRFVEFEYEQTTKGFVVIFIKEIPQ